VLIVRAWVLELLKRAVGDQILFGEASIAGSKRRLTGDERLFWVKPTVLLKPSHVHALNVKKCSACKRQITVPGGFEEQITKAGPGVFDSRYYVDDFGPGKLDIAGMEENYGWPAVVMSGPLLHHLKTSGVKGIVAFTNSLWPRCLFSLKREPTLDSSIRDFGKTVPRPAMKKEDASRLNDGKKAVSSLSKVPWDCQKDGNVYFHLSTREFTVLDPMTGEEDSGGPCTARQFKRPGLFRLPVTAIKAAKGKKSGVAVDSGTLLFVDNAFLPALLENYDWEKATTANGSPNPKYHQRIAEKIGTRFGICSTPSEEFKSDFTGDGEYAIDASKVVPA